MRTSEGLLKAAVVGMPLSSIGALFALLGLVKQHPELTTNKEIEDYLFQEVPQQVNFSAPWGPEEFLYLYPYTFPGFLMLILFATVIREIESGQKYTLH